MSSAKWWKLVVSCINFQALTVILAVQQSNDFHMVETFDKCDQIWLSPASYPPSDEGRGIIRFKDIDTFFGNKNQARLSTISASSTCLSIGVESDSYEAVSRLIDFVRDITVKEKHLLVQMPTALNISLLPTKVLKFEVVISNFDSGRVVSSSIN